MIKVGITGGIGVGKSTICQIFNYLGVPVYYADIEAKILCDTNHTIKKELIQLCGNEIYLETQMLNKKLLAQLIFNDETLRKKVNAIIHPVVKKHFNQWLVQHKKFPYTIHEAALLFESGFYSFFDVLVVVYADKNQKIERIIKRDGLSKAAVIKRIQAQQPDEKKIEKADYIIYNDGTQPIIPQVLQIHKKILQRCF